MSEKKKSSEEPLVGAEPDILPLGKLFVWVGTFCAVLLILLISLWHYHRSQSAAEVTQKQLLPQAPLLAEVRAKDEAALLGYARVDAKKGLYRIPVAQAIELMLSNPRLLLSTPLPRKPKPVRSATANDAGVGDGATKTSDGGVTNVLESDAGATKAPPPAPAKRTPRK